MEINFERVGEFTSTEDTEMGPLHRATGVYRCGHCAALVPEGWHQEHAQWHADARLDALL